jgi:hypothetical protein
MSTPARKSTGLRGGLLSYLVVQENKSQEVHPGGFFVFFAKVVFALARQSTRSPVLRILRVSRREGTNVLVKDQIRGRAQKIGAHISEVYAAPLPLRGERDLFDRCPLAFHRQSRGGDASGCCR